MTLTELVIEKIRALRSGVAILISGKFRYDVTNTFDNPRDIPDMETVQNLIEESGGGVDTARLDPVTPGLIDGQSRTEKLLDEVKTWENDSYANGTDIADKDLLLAGTPGDWVDGHFTGSTLTSEPGQWFPGKDLTENAWYMHFCVTENSWYRSPLTQGLIDAYTKSEADANFLQVDGGNDMTGPVNVNNQELRKVQNIKDSALVSAIEISTLSRHFKDIAGNVVASITSIINGWTLINTDGWGGSFTVNSNTANRTYPMQDKNYTAVADTADIAAAITTLKGGVPSPGDTLNKLYNLIIDQGTFVGGFDASFGALPTTGSGTSGAIDKGDYWKVTVAGTITGLSPNADLKPGDVLYAAISGASVAADFFAIQGNIDQATSSVLGIVKLYSNLSASNTDGSVTQAAMVTALSAYATKTGAETLTNKTLTSPIINVGSDATGDIYFRDSGALLQRLAAGAANTVLSIASGLPSWQTIASLLGFTPAKSMTVTAVKTANYTAAPEEIVRVDSTAGNITITLPTAPADKTKVTILQVVKGTGFSVTAQCAGSDVLNRPTGATSTTITLLAEAKTFEYKASDSTWSITSSNHALSQLDLRFEALANKATDFTTKNNTLYPSVQAVEDRLNQITNPIFFDDFYNINLWRNTGINAGGPIGAVETTGERGVTALTTGTSASGSGSISRTSNTTNTTLLGLYALEFGAKARIDNLSTSTNEYLVFIGFCSVANLITGNAVGFYYDRATDGDFWTVYTRNGGVTTKTVTSIPITINTQYKFKCVINAAGTSVQFYIATSATGAYTLVATHTTNIPNSSNSISPTIFNTKTVGTTARLLYLDYWYDFAIMVNRTV